MVHVVVYDLRAPFVESILSDKERERVRRFSSRDAARRWAAGRVGLRRILAGHTGLQPEALVLSRGPHGKPTLDGSSLHFNKSDCGDLAVVAVSEHREVGVDVEAHRVVTRAERIAGRFFSSSERAELASLPEPQRLKAFFDCWTVKEAVLKCDGGGLGAIAMSSFSAPLDEEWHGGIAGRWWASRFHLGDGLSGAVVLAGTEEDAVELTLTSPKEDASAP